MDQGVYIHNAPRILNDALVRRERCFFWTDHHWTDLGAWYCASAIMESRGYPALAYDEYDYREHPVTNAANREDRLHLMVPLLPTHSYVMKHLTEAEEIDFMNYNYHTYIAYINNTRTPWRIFTGGFGSSRKALLIADSFGNAFLPYLLPYYGEVHMTDLRKSYFDTAEAGGTFRELLSYYNIDDIYIVYSTSNGIPSANAMQVLPAEIAK